VFAMFVVNPRLEQMTSSAQIFSKSTGIDEKIFEENLFILAI
jgi:hypothetical protein